VGGAVINVNFIHFNLNNMITKYGWKWGQKTLQDFIDDGTVSEKKSNEICEIVCGVIILSTLLLLPILFTIIL